MKRFTGYFRITAILFFAAVLSITYYAGYSSGSALSSVDPQQISVQDAQRYITKYLTTAPVQPTGVLHALVVDWDQFDAMSKISQKNTDLSGFRIYYAVDDNNKNVRVVVGLDANGKDKTTQIMSTSAWSSGICPPICDEAGGLMGQ